MSTFNTLALEVHNQEGSKTQKYQLAQTYECPSQLPGPAALQSALCHKVVSLSSEQSQGWKSQDRGGGCSKCEKVTPALSLCHPPPEKVPPRVPPKPLAQPLLCCQAHSRVSTNATSSPMRGQHNAATVFRQNFSMNQRKKRVWRTMAWPPPYAITWRLAPHRCSC